MKTSQNIAKVSAQLIRAAVADLSVYSVTSLDRGPRDMRANALASLREVANQLEQHAAAFDGQSDTPAIEATSL
jgi:hypothetical protein